MLNVSVDQNVSNNIFYEISIYAMEAPTCNIHAIFITICCNL